MGAGRVHRGFGRGNPRKRGHLENRRVVGKIILNASSSNRTKRGAGNGLIWLRINSSSELL
jgi:hypothetical protein